MTCSLSCSFKMTLPSKTMANSSEMDGVAVFPVRPAGLMISIEARNCDGLFSDPKEAISARDQSRDIWERSLARTIVATCWFAERKNCPSVTPSALAIFSMEEMEGEHCPFSIWDKKLAEKSVLSAKARREMPCCSLKYRKEFPRVCSIIDCPLIGHHF